METCKCHKIGTNGLIEPYCGICGSRRKPHKFAHVDMICMNEECMAFDVGIYFDMGAMYDMLLQISKTQT